MTQIEGPVSGENRPESRATTKKLDTASLPIPDDLDLMPSYMARWRLHAHAALEQLARSGEDFTVDDLVARTGPPPLRRQVSGIFGTAQGTGLIEQVGTTLGEDEASAASVARCAMTATLRLIPNHEASLWLRNEIQAIGREWAAGGGASCGHRTPRMATSLWNHQFTCSDCLSDLLVHDPEDHTCDRCRGSADTLNVAVIEVGTLLVALGLCADCADREVGT